MGKSRIRHVQTAEEKEIMYRGRKKGMVDRGRIKQKFIIGSASRKGGGMVKGMM